MSARSGAAIAWLLAGTMGACASDPSSAGAPGGAGGSVSSREGGSSTAGDGQGGAGGNAGAAGGNAGAAAGSAGAAGDRAHDASDAVGETASNSDGGEVSGPSDAGGRADARAPAPDAANVASDAQATDGASPRTPDAGRDAARSGTLRIMPLGDSTTGSVCYRAKLWQKLNQGGFAGRFDFVGSRHNDAGCGVAGYDQDNEGHPSVLVTKFVADADDQVAGTQTLADVVGKHPADVVLLHFATNDVWNGVAPAAILSAYDKVLAALRVANPSVVVLVAKLIPMAVTGSTCSGCSCPECPSRITTLNDMLPAWAASSSRATSPIEVVDQWTGFNASANVDTVDGVHPNAAGSQKIADRWYTALAPWF